MITKKMVVRRFSSRTEYSGYQLLQFEIRIFTVLIWRQTVDREEIPTHVLIEIACLGAQIAWKSKFAEYLI